VALYQIRIVAVHHANEFSQFSGGLGMNAAAKIGCFPLQIDRQVSENGRNGILKHAGFNPSRGFDHFLPITYIVHCQ
jgi:hypothetical protein